MSRVFLLYFFISILPMNAESYMPEGKPEVDLIEALREGEAFLAKSKIDISTFYVQRTNLGYLKNDDKRSWLIAYASSKFGYIFIAIYMDKSCVLLAPNPAEIKSIFKSEPLQGRP